MPRRSEIERADGRARAGRDAAWCGSRAATRSSSAAAARRREALRAAGVPFEVVPGVTAGVAAPAYAGIPVTHRDDASAVAFVTGHEDPDKAGDGARLGGAGRASPARSSSTWASGGCREIAERLIAAGRDAGEPAAAVERGTMPGQRTVDGHARATLARGGRTRRRSAPPAIVVIGPVAARREALAWLERRPLHGRRVVVTRARAQASGLARALRALGAEVVELPAIRIEPRLDSAEVRDGRRARSTPTRSSA